MSRNEPEQVKPQTPNPQKQTKSDKNAEIHFNNY
jgi:hypothetical protein